jgi:hypothetical protein
MPDGEWPTTGPLALQGANTSTPKRAAVRQNPGGPVPDGGYKWCANEGGTKTFDSPVDVAYGEEGKYNFKYGVTGTITFDNDTFGDPIPGTVKEGFWRPSESKP